ncbi:MAG: hypothetical protein ACF8MJ_05530 [Phycisphaerales bacterium JB050]
MLLLLYAAIVVQPARPAAASDGNGDVPLAVISVSDLEQTAEVSLASESPTLDDLELEQLFDQPEVEMPASAIDFSALDLSNLGDVGGAGVIDDAAGSSVFESGGGGAASFFGVEAGGNRFAYIVDVSGSMEGQRIEILKRELTRSIVGLRSQSQFTIVLFSSGAFQLGPEGWRNASDSGKRSARAEINNIRAGGTTIPFPAFEEVFRMRPRPDAIYFMTDGAFSNAETVAEEIARLSRSTGKIVPIHCITFIERDAEEIMKVIARQSNGSYTHVTGDAP